ncbi:MAG: hypothetical protein HRU15_15525 [Planctomycetes bacterium]|nr:hypothetical protein [Planctomycetota bacterium]
MMINKLFLLQLAYPILSICLYGYSSTHLMAAELVLRDIRITTESLPGDFDFTLNNSLQSTTGSGEFDSGLGITVGGMYGFTGAGDHSGYLVGAELTIGQYGFGSNGDYSTTGIRAYSGYGWQLTDSWYLLSEVYMGYGLATITFPTTTAFNSFEADGTNIEYGLRTGIGYAINDTWLISLNLGYGFGTAELDNSGNDVDLEIEQTGLSGMIGFTYRLSHMPRRLE